MINSLYRVLHKCTNNICNVAHDNSTWLVSYTTSQVHITFIRLLQLGLFTTEASDSYEVVLRHLRQNFLNPIVLVENAQNWRHSELKHLVFTVHGHIGFAFRNCFCTGFLRFHCWTERYSVKTWRCVVVRRCRTDALLGGWAIWGGPFELAFAHVGGVVRACACCGEMVTQTHEHRLHGVPLLQLKVMKRIPNLFFCGSFK